MSIVQFEIKDRIAYLTLNRPDKRNALNFEMVQLLKEHLDVAEKNDQIKVVILRSAGDVFCAGADLESLQQLQKNTYEENLDDSKHLMELYKKIYYHPKIVIAQIQGHALAGGCGLVTVCDFSFSVQDANYGYTESRIGFVPAIVMVFLIRKIGEAKAKELLLTGNPINASEAVKWGIINKIVEDEDLASTVEQFAHKLCVNNSGNSMSITKHMIAEIQSMHINDALNFACEQNALARNSEDCKKGIAAFLNKTKITW